MNDFKSQGFTVSEFFKTNARFGYQVILTDEILLRATSIYVESFRPVAIRNATKKILSTSHDFLWLTYEGDQHTQIGKYVTKLFAAYDFHITTCDLRSLAETKSNDAMLSGKISPAHRNAITDLNGHSSQVTKDYYLKTDRIAESSFGREGFAQMLGLQSEVVTDEATHWRDEGIDEDSKYGSAHPDKGNPITKRARWTREEINFIGHWIRGFIREHPKSTRVLSKLLDHIWKTPSCHSIFHPRHVLTTSRLKSGLDAYEREHGPINET